MHRAFVQTNAELPPQREKFDCMDDGGEGAEAQEATATLAATKQLDIGI